MSNLPSEVDQVDATLAEDNRTVILTGHTLDQDRTFIASFTLSEPIDRETDDLRREWQAMAPSLDWRLAT